MREKAREKGQKVKTILSVCILIVMTGSISFCQAKVSGLEIGVQAPPFSENNAQGKRVTLSDVYENGPVVLIFYHGGWCVQCIRQLAEYQELMGKFTNANASIVAVSVDTAERSAVTVKKHRLTFEVISNPCADILYDYNVVCYMLDAVYQKYLTEDRIDIEEASERIDHLIAMPTTYVINNEGVIVYAHASEDCTSRPSPVDILQVVRDMQCII